MHRHTELKPLKPGSSMTHRIFLRSVCSIILNIESLSLCSNIQRLDIKRSPLLSLVGSGSPGNWLLVVSRTYACASRQYDLFGKGKHGEKQIRRSWEKEMNESSSLWSGSDEDEESDIDIDEHVKKLKKEAEERASLIDADDSDELRSVWSGSDEEKTLWTGSECDDDDDIPTEPHLHERSDSYIDKLFEFEEAPKYRTISELLKAENEPPELSPGKQGRKLAVENALKKLKKGPDGRYTNVWEVMTDIDILIGAFENVVSGPEYTELRARGSQEGEHGVL
ncbi:hypothetical protein H6P81_008935 [Aristolochia fimbriata]|uniref:Uncharacterized protein n=1 Tax=Aristolochia fimbriata TaxID=158543 RepID=A0AAV7EJF4_ARIFI|nr:hypothetical protein H6P81_008935 [Aristolochia fimbriata]